MSNIAVKFKLAVSSAIPSRSDSLYPTYSGFTHSIAMASKATEPIASFPASVETYVPLVSVIIPAYNAARYLDRTLASVLSQTHRHLEVIVVDDGSQDGTPGIVKRWAERDARVRFIQQVNGGVAIARNTGIAQAKGEFIAPVDADDIWYAENLARQVQRLTEAGPRAGVCYGWSVDIDEQDQPNGGFRAATIEGPVYRSMLCHNFLGNASSTVIRRSALAEIGGYDASLKQRQAQGCEDWDLYLRLAEKYEYCVAPQFLIGYRKTDAAMSGDYRQMGRSQALMLEAVRQLHPEIPGALYQLSRSSFYLYLARQSELSSQPRETLYWLGQALKAEWVTPLGRYGLYSMAWGSAWKLWQGKAKLQEGGQPCDVTDSDSSDADLSALDSSQVSPQHPLEATNPAEFFREEPLEVQPFAPPTNLPGGFSLRFKLGLGNLLHRLLQ